MTGGIAALDQDDRLTNNRLKVIGIASLVGLLEFFDQFAIAFVLVFIIHNWALTFGQSAFILLSSGIGSIIGSLVWGAGLDWNEEAVRHFALI